MATILARPASPYRSTWLRTDAVQLALSAGLGAGFGDLLFNSLSHTRDWFDAAVVSSVVLLATVQFIEPLASWLRRIIGARVDEHAPPISTVTAFSLALTGFLAVLLHHAVWGIVHRSPLGAMITLAVAVISVGLVTTAWTIGAHRKTSHAAAFGGTTAAIVETALVWCFLVSALGMPGGEAIAPALGAGLAFGLTGFMGGLAIDRRWFGGAIGAALTVIATSLACTLAGAALSSQGLTRHSLSTLFVAAGWALGLVSYGPANRLLFADRPAHYQRTAPFTWLIGAALLLLAILTLGRETVI